MMRRLLLAAAAGAVLGGCALIPPTLPENQPVKEVRWLSQNWGDKDRFWYHHETQGTSTLPIPYKWFVSLEQPGLWFFGEPPMLIDSDYLRRFGFIPSPKGVYPQKAALKAAGYAGDDKAATYNARGYSGNPDGLPVGFAITKGYDDPVTGKPLPDQIGFTCAACHTGHIEYQGTALRVDGGPAITDLGKFRTALGLALVYTKFLGSRFDRFAERVLGPNHTEAEAALLKVDLNDTLATLEKGQKIYAESAKDDINEGFGRLDALNRIGNTVFVDDLLAAPGFDATQNIKPITAPVNYPHVWDTSWFKWVQYDASIEQPMVRNAGESMGVSARLNLANPARPLYASSIPVMRIHEMEELLAGRETPQASPRGFKGLHPPKWPADVLGPVTGDVERGKALYSVHCQGCHLPPTDSAAFWDPALWTTPNDAGQSYLKLPLIELDHIGTDPAQAMVLPTRKVTVPSNLEIDPGKLCDGTKPMGVQTDLLFALALGYVVEATVDHQYDQMGIPEADRDRLNGYRPNCLEARTVYKARPLDGIWATPPFLHNGSVPTLWDLLSPVAERPKTFCLGLREFDPEKVGYVTSCAAGTTKIDTSIPGNLNIGHAFQDEPGKGVLGPAFSEADRMALIAYLKTL